MPLERKGLTKSSRTMVPAYPLLSLGVAVAYIFGDPERTATPSFDVAREVMAIRGFGYVFLVVAVLQIGGMLSKAEPIYVLGLAIGFGVSVAWAGFFIGSILFTDNASLTSWMLWAFVAIAHIATLRSLTQDRLPARDVSRRDRATD